jgi:signal transduction histidine kinase
VTPLARMPIRLKVTLAIVGVSAMALVVSSAAFVAYDRSASEQTLVERLSGECEIVGFNSASAIVFQDPRSAATTLGALRSDPAVVSAAIYTAQGDLFATYERSGAATARPPDRLPPGTPPGRAARGPHLSVSQPIEFEGARVGTLVVRADRSELAAQLRRYALLVVIVFLVALALAVLAGAAIQRVLTRPILSLAEVAGRVSERSDFTARVPPQAGRDELALLVTAFNQMLDGLQRRDDQLREAHGELEQRLEERTALYRQAAEANRLKDEFLATLSHELRTPLNAIVGWTALLVRGEIDPEMEDRAVAAIDRNARAQMKIVEDVLDVSRIVSGKLSLKVGPVDLREIVTAALEAVSHAATARRIAVELRVEGDTSPIAGDPDRLQQVVWNLLSNAIKFTDTDGHVAVTVSQSGGQARIVVADDGIGIAPEFLPHVFERFRQADASTTRAHGGLGLGLAIVRHLVEMHGGTVAAHSAGTGRGATFTVTLPADPPRPAGGGGVRRGEAAVMAPVARGDARGR